MAMAHQDRASVHINGLPCWALWSKSSDELIAVNTTQLTDVIFTTERDDFPTAFFEFEFFEPFQALELRVLFNKVGLPSSMVARDYDFSCSFA